MRRGKGTHVAVGILVLLFAAGLASAVPTFPVCLRGVGTLLQMTDNPAFDAVLLDTRGRDPESPTPEILLLPALPGQASGMDSGPALLMEARETLAKGGLDIRDVGFEGTTCQVPSPGTLLLGAIGAFLIGALRMRRML